MQSILLYAVLLPSRAWLGLRILGFRRTLPLRFSIKVSMLHHLAVLCTIKIDRNGRKSDEWRRENMNELKYLSC